MEAVQRVLLLQQQRVQAAKDMDRALFALQEESNDLAEGFSAYQRECQRITAEMQQISMKIREALDSLPTSSRTLVERLQLLERTRLRLTVQIHQNWIQTLLQHGRCIPVQFIGKRLFSHELNRVSDSILEVVSELSCTD
jgi:hypothetical protein